MADFKSRELNVNDVKWEPGMPTEGHIGEKPQSRSIGKLTIELDCADALTGLKAIQREAKKATQALRELEEAQKPDLTKVSTADLHNELRFRKGIEGYDLAIGHKAKISVDFRNCGDVKEIDGPARIIINRD